MFFCNKCLLTIELPEVFYKNCRCHRVLTPDDARKRTDLMGGWSLNLKKIRSLLWVS
jgi:hypothetical protein